MAYVERGALVISMAGPRMAGWVSGESCSFSLFTTLKTVFIPNTIQQHRTHPFSDAAPPPSSAPAGAPLLHAVYALLRVYTYIKAAARLRSGVLPLLGSHGLVDRTLPVFDSMTEGKEPVVAPQLKGKELMTSASSHSSAHRPQAGQRARRTRSSSRSHSSTT